MVKVRDESVIGDGGPIRMAEEKFDHVADGNNGQETGNNRFQGPEAVAFQAEDDEGDNGGQQPGNPERQPEEQDSSATAAPRNSARSVAMATSSIRTHMLQTTQRGKALPAMFGQVLAGCNAQFGRQGLQEHGHQVAAQDDPEQFVAELCAALDVGGEIAGST